LYYFQVLREFVAALKLPPALFIGNSLGGNAAARLAIEQPQAVQGLVLVSPGGFTPHNFVSRAFCRLQGGRFSIPPKLFARMYLRRRTPTVQEMLTRAATEQATPERLAVNRAVWRGFVDPRHDLRQAAAAIKAPVLVVVGRHDPVIPANKDGRIAAQAIPGARLFVPPSGHAPFAETPDEFLAEVLPFLAQCADT
jgi:pimeloyl-ACP methyl ester carboxylesterase